jgi:hypothetical protein
MKKISQKNKRCDVTEIYSFGQKYQNRNAYGVLGLKPEGRKSFGRTRSKWTRRIGVVSKGIGRQVLGRIANTIMNLLFS